MCSEEMNKKFNFNKAVFPGIQGGPLMHVIAGKAVCFKEALQPEYKTYMEQVVRNAKALCNGLKSRGVKIVSGDTDNHLMLVDLGINSDLTKQTQNPKTNRCTAAYSTGVYRTEPYTNNLFSRPHSGRKDKL